VIPKASNPGRIAANLDVFGFSLSDTDMAAVAAMDSGRRSGSNPNNVN
jgi:2,5-diketo-D-gluconate reductase A